MAIITRESKDDLLTHEELDGNFVELQNKIVTLENMLKDYDSYKEYVDYVKSKIGVEAPDAGTLSQGYAYLFYLYFSNEPSYKPFECYPDNERVSFYENLGDNSQFYWFIWTDEFANYLNDDPNYVLVETYINDKLITANTNTFHNVTKSAILNANTYLGQVPSEFSAFNYKAVNMAANFNNFYIPKEELETGSVNMKLIVHLPHSGMKFVVYEKTITIDISPLPDSMSAGSIMFYSDGMTLSEFRDAFANNFVIMLESNTLIADMTPYSLNLSFDDGTIKTFNDSYNMGEPGISADHSYEYFFYLMAEMDKIYDVSEANFENGKSVTVTLDIPSLEINQSSTIDLTNIYYQGI